MQEAPREQRDREQRERALQRFELVVLDPPEPACVETVRRVLRAKRFERDALAARIPGAVRRGAHADLEPLAEALRRAGVRCALRPRAGSDPAPG